MYITDDKWSNLGDPAPRLQPRCYSLTLTVPNTYDELEAAVGRWISTCVMSRTEVRPGVPIHRERELVNGNATLKGIWDRVLQYLKGKSVKIDADYVWGIDREEAIKFSTTASPPPPPPPPPPPKRIVTPASPTVCPPTSCTPSGLFLPSTHGFRFDNSFTLSIPLPRPLPAISGSYGLCGGMASAALDYYLSCIPIPSTSSVPSAGTTLHKYLFDRLLDSLGTPTFGMVMKFMSWTQRPDTDSNMLTTAYKAIGPLAALLYGPLPAIASHFIKVDGVQELTAREEFPKIVAELNAGRMVVVGLVYVGPGKLNIWDNHQVLAYGIERVSSTVTKIKIYDPNYNRDDRIYLRCELANGGSRVQCEEVIGAKTERVRGFFRMPYTRKIPPCL
jgi:hypothetical protein